MTGATVPSPTVTRVKPFWRDLPKGREVAILAAIATGTGFLAAIIFTIWPQADQAVSSWYFLGSGRFSLAVSPLWSTIRDLQFSAYRWWYVVMTVCLLLALWLGVRPLRLDLKKWTYLALAAAAGPLLLVNILLKEHWGRWRPREITIFGGDERFTTPLDLSGTCLDNCSFVSGEVASMAMFAISLALVTKVWRPVFYGLFFPLWSFAALLRIGQGAHFFSDSIFSGVFMVLVACAVYWAMFLRTAR